MSRKQHDPNKRTEDNSFPRFVRGYISFGTFCKIKSITFKISIIILNLLFCGAMYLTKLMECSETSHAVTFKVNKDQTKEVTEFAKP